MDLTTSLPVAKALEGLIPTALAGPLLQLLPRACKAAAAASAQKQQHAAEALGSQEAARLVLLLEVYSSVVR